MANTIEFEVEDLKACGDAVNTAASHPGYNSQKCLHVQRLLAMLREMVDSKKNPTLYLAYLFPPNNDWLWERLEGGRDLESMTLTDWNTWLLDKAQGYPTQGSGELSADVPHGNDSPILGPYNIPDEIVGLPDFPGLNALHDADNSSESDLESISDDDAGLDDHSDAHHGIFHAASGTVEQLLQYPEEDPVDDEPVAPSDPRLLSHIQAIDFVNGLEQVNIEDLELEDRRCPFCWGTFGEVVEHEDAAAASVVKTPCKHNFHMSCMVGILEKSSTSCPVCRADLCGRR